MATYIHTVEDGRGNVLSTTTRTVPVEVENLQAIRAKAAAALAANATFLAIPAPTNAQTLAQVKLLTRETNALIRIVLSLFDSQADT